MKILYKSNLWNASQRVSLDRILLFCCCCCAEFEFALWMNGITFYLCSLMQDAIKLTQAFVIKIAYTTHTQTQNTKHIQFEPRDSWPLSTRFTHKIPITFYVCSIIMLIARKVKGWVPLEMCINFHITGNVILGVSKYDSFLWFIFCDTAIRWSQIMNNVFVNWGNFTCFCIDPLSSPFRNFGGSFEKRSFELTHWESESQTHMLIFLHIRSYF